VKFIHTHSLNKEFDDFIPVFTDLVALPVNGIAEMVDLQAALDSSSPPGGCSEGSKVHSKIMKSVGEDSILERRFSP
jgi:hypothetical protein